MKEFFKDKRKKVNPYAITANPNIYLEGTKLFAQSVAMIFTGGGLGDYINFSSAVLWAVKENPQVTVHLFCREPFIDVAKFIFKDFSNCHVLHHKELPNVPDHSLVVYPKDQLINATGAHLMDLGFMYYAQMDRPPKGYEYLPELKFNEPFRWDVLKGKPYAVFTPGATARARVMYGRYFNELVSYTLSRGITPVFLGKRDFAHNVQGEGYVATFQDDYDLTKGIDLTEKTTLLEAIHIMSKACFVIGLDNGLLHFAGTTSTPIIFGHNVASVAHREIRRKTGLTINIHVDEKSLSCIGCQSKMRFIKGHRFSKCLYEGSPANAYACLDYLFHEGCLQWKKAIDHILMLPITKFRMNNWSTNETD